MGFWHTGYFEHHEESGLEYTFEPTPIYHHCSICKAEFTALEDLRQHRFEQHPFFRPAIFVRGRQLGATPFRITHAVSVVDFVVDDRVLRAEVNGVSTPIEVLTNTLTTFTNDRVSLTLFSEGTSATFEIIFDIASESDLTGVETCFENLAKTRDLDMGSIEGFISDSKPYISATAYCDGICQYLYGVLTKERSCDSTLPHAAYQEKFNQATDTLAAYDRPVARCMRALVAFHFNHFEDVVGLISKGRLATASRRFGSWLKGSKDATTTTHRGEAVRGSVEDMLTDFDTSKILDWTLAEFGAIKSQMTDLEEMLRQDIPGFDRAKLIMLLAEQYAYHGELTKARRFARELVSNASTAIWAEKLLEQLPMENRE